MVPCLRAASENWQLMLPYLLPLTTAHQSAAPLSLRTQSRTAHQLRVIVLQEVIARAGFVSHDTLLQISLYHCQFAPVTERSTREPFRPSQWPH
jgi:hypothetical protein